MPPKQNTTVNVAPRTVPMADLKALCWVLATADGFKMNTKDLAPHLGIKIPANVGRRIRTIIEPAGFELVDGKVTAKDGSGKPGDGEDDDSAAAPATPAKGKRGMPKTPASKRGNKKRKVEEDDDDEMAHKIEEELKSKDEV